MKAKNKKHIQRERGKIYLKWREMTIFLCLHQQLKRTKTTEKVKNTNTVAGEKRKRDVGRDREGQKTFLKTLDGRRIYPWNYVISV